MRIYQLYLIKDEFAARYFGKVRKFFLLFKEYADSSSKKKDIISRQIDFIIKPIPRLELQKYLQQYFHKNNNFHFEDGSFSIKEGNNSEAKLEVFENRLILTAKGSYYAETVFFEALRKNRSSFLAVDLNNHYCGWLRPIKTNKVRKFV